MLKGNHFFGVVKIKLSQRRYCR